MGATAIAVLSFFAIREYRVPVNHEPTAELRPAAVTVAAPVGVAVTVAAVTHLPSVPAAAVEVRQPEPVDTVAAADDVPTPSLGVVPVVAMLGEPAPEKISPSARTIAANRAMAQAVDPELANRYLNTARGFEARALPSRQPAIEPLAQVSLSDARRVRQFVAAMPVAFNAANPASSEKIARKISDERLYDTVSRFGASGDRVKIKF